MSYDPSGGLTGWISPASTKDMTPSAGAAWARDERRRARAWTIFGTRFSVWAPNAQAVRLVGDFNYWNGEGHYMHLIPEPEVWALFIEGASTGSLYKFEVLGADSVWRLKADPMAQFAEAAPPTASIVYESQYVWGDDDWMWYPRAEGHARRAMSVYEVRRIVAAGLTYLELANELVEYVTWRSYTHVEFMPVVASVRGFLGLSRHRLLRSHVEVRLAG